MSVSIGVQAGTAWMPIETDAMRRVQAPSRAYAYLRASVWDARAGRRAAATLRR